MSRLKSDNPFRYFHSSPEAVVTDGLRSYPAAMHELGNIDRREMGQWANNRAENSHFLFL